MMKDFYVYLPSNNKYMRSNRSWSYITKLAREISVPAGYEVGIKEIHFPISWSTIKQGECTFRVKDTEEGQWRSLEIPGGHYTRRSLVDEMKKLINNKGMHISYHEGSGKIEIGPLGSHYIQFTQPLTFMLGYTAHEVILTGNSTYTGNTPIDTNRGIDSLYVYTDIVQSKLVGDSSVPLIAVVPVNGTYGEMQFKEYTNPIYSELSKNVFSTIEINLYSSSGEPIPFEFGKVTVLLHFREKQ